MPSTVRKLAIGAELDRPLQPADVADARKHGLLGLLHKRTTAEVNCSLELARQLAARDLREQQRSQRQQAAAAAVADLLGGRFQWMLIKGLSVSTRWYPHPHCRSASDIDVWIDDSDPDRFVEAIEALGLDDRCRDVRSMLQTDRVFTEHARIDGVGIDVHRDGMNLLLPTSDVYRVFGEHLTEVDIGGRGVPVPDLELALVITAIHAARDGFPVWKSVADARFMTEAGPDWRRLERLVDEEGWTPIVSNALDVLMREFGEQSPLEPSPLSRRVARSLWPTDRFSGPRQKTYMRRRQSLVPLMVNRRRRATVAALVRRTLPERHVIEHRSAVDRRSQPYVVALAGWRAEQWRSKRRADDRSPSCAAPETLNRSPTIH